MFSCRILQISITWSFTNVNRVFGQWVLFINYYKLWYKIDQVHAYTLICANNKIINSSIKYVIANNYKFDLENSVIKSLIFKNVSGEGANPYRTYPHSELCASVKPAVSYKCLHITTVLAKPCLRKLACQFEHWG